MSDCSSRRFPRAGVDPIDGPDVALAVIDLAVCSADVPETVVLLLDRRRRGLGITVVSETWFPDDVLEVVECISGVARPTDGVRSDIVRGLVVASVRPEGLDPAVADGDDQMRWLELDQLATSAGLELVEWFVIGRHTICPRDLVGAPPRW